MARPLKGAGRFCKCLCANRFRDMHPAIAESVDVRGRTTQRRFERVHANLVDGCPVASPAGAPGRDSSQACTFSSISSVDAAGKIRRMRVRYICTPNSDI